MIEDITKSIPMPAPALSLEVREVCAALDISPSGFYAHRHKDERLRRCEDQVLAGALKNAFAESGALMVVRA